MTLVGDLADKAANAPSIMAATDRAMAVQTPRFPQSATINSSLLLATSPSPTEGVQSLQARLLAARRKHALKVELEKGVDADGYPFCQYRKGFWDHLKPRSLIIGTLRVSIQQATTILVSFISDQLELDLKRNVRVNEGALTQMEADLEAEEWEKVEWEKRWKLFPGKFLVALVKFHAVTLILRSYELVASKLVNLRKLDKLTTDPFVIAKRLSTKLKEQKAHHKKPKRENVHVTISMTQTALWANLLPFFADYTLHQGLLCFAYYKYYNYQRSKRIEDAVVTTSPRDPDEQSRVASDTLIELTEEQKVLLSDLAEKSGRLASNRGLGWFCSALGAGIGSVVWAGWGTIVCSSLGDVVAGAVLDDGYFKARVALEEKQKEEEARDAARKATVQ